MNLFVTLARMLGSGSNAVLSCRFLQVGFAYTPSSFKFFNNAKVGAGY